MRGWTLQQAHTSVWSVIHMSKRVWFNLRNIKQNSVMAMAIGGRTYKRSLSLAIIALCVAINDFMEQRKGHHRELGSPISEPAPLAVAVEWSASAMPL